jgi:hypothetical protein
MNTSVKQLCQDVLIRAVFSIENAVGYENAPPQGGDTGLLKQALSS